MKKDLFSGLSKKNFDIKKFKELKKILSKQGIVIKMMILNGVNVGLRVKIKPVKG